MKRIFKHSSALLLAIPVALLIILAIGCDAPGEQATEPAIIVVDTPAKALIDTLPTIDTTTGDKPPVPVTKS